MTKALEELAANAARIVAIEPLPGSGLDKALSVVWGVGRRCNYACSYCSKEFHDKTSPHRSFGELRAVWTKMRREMAARNLVARIEFTGGEATLNPDFLGFVRYLDRTQRPWLRQMGMTSNGSATLEYYEELTNHLDWLTLSTHFEWWDENRFMTTLLDLKRSLVRRGRPQWAINVNLMYEEWNAPEIQRIKRIIDAENIASTPIYIYNIHGSKGITNKSSTPFDYERYQNSRGIVPTPLPEPAMSRPDVPEPDAPPAASSLNEVLLEHSSSLEGANTQLTLDDGSRMSVHSQVFTNLHLNNFPGWLCNAGKDRMFINVDGMVYGGMCRMVDMGDIRKEFKLSEEPVVCDGRDCHCMSDIIVKKWKQEIRASVDAKPTRPASAAD
jgi:hypothetical protein